MKKYTKAVLAVCAVFGLCLAAYAVTWNGATTIFSSQTRSDESYASATANQNSLLISTSGKVTVNNAAVTKAGDSLQEELCRYYGVNAAVMCKSSDEKGQTYFNGGNIQADAEGGDGLVCYFASAYVTDSIISSPRSRGVVAAEKGFVSLKNTRVYSDSIQPYGGALCAEYWGNLSISGGKAWGSVCPAVYSRWYVFAEDAELLSQDSPAVMLADGGNAELHDCSVKLDPQSENPFYAVKFVTENDSSGQGSFIMFGGEIDSMDKFWAAASDAYIYLKEVDFPGFPGTFLEVDTGEDENAGIIGGNVTLDMQRQSAAGPISVSTLSSLNMTMDGESSFEGYINNAGPEGDVAVTVTGGSVWTLTGDSWISSLKIDGPENIELNGSILYVDGVPFDPAANQVTGVTLDKTSASVTVGGTVTLTASVTPSWAADKAVTWQSYDKTIATVDANGKVKGIAPGATTIRVKTRDGGFTAKCKVTVKEPTVAVTGVALNKTKATLDKGASVTLKATVSPSDATNKAVTWTSYDTSIATVDANGKVKGVAPGTTTIRVKTKDGGFTAKCKVTVQEPTVAVTGVALNKTKVTLDKGSSVTLKAAVSPADATDKTVTWSSYDKTIATVDANGKVKGIAPGTTTIRVKTKDGGFTAKCKVTVKEPTVAVTGVALDKTKVTLDKGASVTLKATVSPSDAANKAVTWTSYDTSIATVDANGKVKGIAPGTTTVRVKTRDGGFTAKCKVTVK